MTFTSALNFLFSFSLHAFDFPQSFHFPVFGPDIFMVVFQEVGPDPLATFGGFEGFFLDLIFFEAHVDLYVGLVTCEVVEVDFVRVALTEHCRRLDLAVRKSSA